MGEIKITNRTKALKLRDYKEKNEFKKWEFHELICHEMDGAGIASAEALAEKMSHNTRNIIEISLETIKNYTNGKRRYYNKEGKSRNNQQKILIAMAEAFVTTDDEPQPDTALINRKKDELQPDTASVNRKVNERLNEWRKEAERLTDEAYNWGVSIKSISKELKTTPAQQVRLLCKSYPQLLSVPSDASETVALYSWLDEANQAQFSTYMRVLLDESHSELPLQYFEIFDIFEKPAFAASYELMDSDSLFQLLKSTFPDKENTREADAFCESLYWLLNQNYREIVKSYLLLDSDIKREMILRISDQMLVVQKAAIT